MAVTMKPLAAGKSYHFNVIYNHARLRREATEDQKLSLDFVKFLVDKLFAVGYTKSYYHDEDSLPGRDVFKELFRVLNESQWTVIVMTEEFSTNSWVEYCKNATFMKLIDGGIEDSLIPIALGNAKIPEELAAKQWLTFDAEPDRWSEGKVEKIIKVLDQGLLVTRAECNTPKEDPGDGILRSEVGHMIVNPQPSMQDALNITQNMNETQMESLSSSVEAMHVSSTLPLLPGSQATSSRASQDHETSSSSSRTDKEDMEKRYVMISYSWTQKKKALWIKKQLEDNRYPVWIDEVNMGQKLHSSLAEAVEGAYVVLLCMSEEYKKSQMCQDEALYSKNNKKKIIPLKLEDFEPKGWLGFATADYLYYDFSGKKSYEEEMRRLLKDLAKHYKKKEEECKHKITPFSSFVMPQE